MWNPSKQCIEAVDKTCQGVVQLMYSTSLYLMLSFQQPHFRTKYLSGYHADRLAITTDTIDAVTSSKTVVDTAADITADTSADADSMLPWFLQSEQDDSDTEKAEGAEGAEEQQEVCTKDGQEEASFGTSVLGHSQRYGWTLSYDIVKSDSLGSFEHFLYVMRKV